MRYLLSRALILLGILNFGVALIIPAASTVSWHSGALHVQSTYKQLVKDGRIVEQSAGQDEDQDVPVLSLLTPRNRSTELGIPLMGWLIFQGIVLVIAGVVVSRRRESRNAGM